MYARIVKFEGADPDRLDSVAEMINNSDGPPEGVPATGVLILADRSKGTNYTIAFFDSEEDMRKGDETLNEMAPPGPGTPGRRTSVDLCEVLVKRESGDRA